MLPDCCSGRRRLFFVSNVVDLYRLLGFLFFFLLFLLLFLFFVIVSSDLSRKLLVVVYVSRRLLRIPQSSLRSSCSRTPTRFAGCFYLDRLLVCLIYTALSIYVLVMTSSCPILIVCFTFQPLSLHGIASLDTV